MAISCCYGCYIIRRADLVKSGRLADRLQQPLEQPPAAGEAVGDLSLTARITGELAAIGPLLEEWIARPG